MTTIYLIRHGETDWNVEERMQGQTDIPLNKNGIAQAQACGAFLQSDDYDLIISSNLLRARKTAEIINSYLNLPFEQMEEFGERNFGDAEGLTIEENALRYPNGIYPNGENTDEFNHRIIDGLEKVHKRYPSKRILLVSHGAVINQVLEILSNGLLGYGKSWIDNTSITTIKRIDNSWIIHDYNQKDHLKEK